jgi:hypothetical protein
MNRGLSFVALLAFSSCLESITEFPRDAGGLACGTGTTRCGAQCVDLKLDDMNCGACGTVCPAGQACAGSRCLPKTCTASDCGADQVCVNGVVCRERLCVNVACPAGQTCRAGVCEAEACGATPCLPGSVCVGGICTDVACLGVRCPTTATCITGQCYPNDCTDADCAANQVCVNDVTCEERRCVTVRCESGQTCVDGSCRPEACGAVPCPGGQSCVNGVCTDTRCVGVSCSGGRTCQNGACVVPAGCDAGVQDDVANCGQCGRVCPVPLNATARCLAGQCGRGPCAAGFFDLDGDVTPGCESTCAGLNCTLPDGGTVTLTVPPLSERGSGGISAGAAAGTSTQTNATHRHSGALGEGPGVSGASANGAHRNVGGLNGLQR